MKRHGWRGICLAFLLTWAAMLASCSSLKGDPVPPTAQASASAQALTPEMIARADIQACYDAMARALQAKDIKGYMAPFASDYTFTNELGETETRASIQSQMKDALGYTDTIVYSTRIDRFRLEGERAQLGVTETMTSTKTDKAGKHVIEVQHVLESQWTKGRDGWKLARAREKSVTMTLDGKPLGGAEPAPAPSTAASAHP